MDKKFLLRKSTGDQPISAEAELREWIQNGQCKPADFLYDFSAKKWSRAGDHPALASFFTEKPSSAPDRRVIYILPPSGTAAALQGPFSTKEIQVRAQAREICASTWVFVEGDKEWRQVRNVKILNDMLPALPTDQPEAPPPSLMPSGPPIFTSAPQATAPAPAPAPAAAAPSTPPPFSAPSPGAVTIDSGSVALPPPEPEVETPSMPSITLDLGAGTPPSAPKNAPLGATAVDPAISLSLSSPPTHDDDSHIEREEVTLALDTMGLNLHSEHATANAPPPPPKGGRPLIMPMPSAGGAPPLEPPKAPAPSLAAQEAEKNRTVKDDGFDGIVAEIPMDPIWLVKPANSETVSGPFRFLEVIQFLEQGKLTKNDKIARTGNKAFTKIGQQYEFNVKFSLENVIENGQEKQKILIRRRHPRVPYMTGVQILSKYGLQAGQCVNISAGGILMEVPKAEFNLGEIIEVKILPGLIAKSISCKSLIIGKIPKIPPGYALKFEDLKPEDKEAIEYYVQETLKREMSKKN
ncbi:MAG: PilZ domain-containing protein [Bdellovibrionota bacterium]